MKFRFILVILLVFKFTIGFSQYANQVNETEDKMELTYCYHYNSELNSLFSVSTTLRDTNVTGSGANYLEFKRYDENYNVISNTQYGDSIHRYTNFYGMEYLNHSYYSCGVKRSVVAPDTLKAYVIRWDTLGAIMWEKEYYQNYEDARIGFLSQNNNFLFFTALISNPTSSPSSVNSTVTKIDTSGNEINDVLFGGYNQQSKSLRTTSDNGFIISTQANYHFGALNPIVYKIDSNLNIKWQKVLGPPDRNHALQFFELPNGNYLGVGSSEEPATGYLRSWLVELDSANGQVLKDTVYWFAERYSGFNIFSNVIFREHDFIVTALKSANPLLNGAPYHILLLSISYDYSINWEREYFHRSSDQGIYNMYEKDNFYHLQGLVFKDSPTNTHDEWFLVVDSLGCDDAVCTVGVEEMLQFDNDDNLKIYPNPAQDNINISVNDAHKTNSTYQLQISDITGKTVLSKTITQTSNIDISILPNGVYILTLGSKTHKMKTEKLIIQR